MNTAENHGNNSSKGQKFCLTAQDTVCVSPIGVDYLWLIECQPLCWYTDNNMFSAPSSLLTGRTLPSWVITWPAQAAGVLSTCCCLSTQTPDQIVSGTKTFRIYSLRSWLDILYKSRSLWSLVCRIIPGLIIPRSSDSWLICEALYCDHEKCVHVQAMGSGLSRRQNIFVGTLFTAILLPLCSRSSLTQFE